MTVLRASISDGILAKADRLFRNDDAGVFIELLQNSRRAGADLVSIWIEPLEGEKHGSNVVFRDNGRGIEDFQRLLTLGGSGWDADVQAAEDPAGMGFFSLCHSDVEVASGDRSVVLSREVFLGKAEANVQTGRTVFVDGTRLIFTRPSTPVQLLGVLKHVTQFFPVQVRVNGEELPRHDFLEGSLHREWIDGVEVGFSTNFRWSPSYSDDNWNFHGLRIRKQLDDIPGLLEFDEHRGWHSKTIETRFNVVETGRVKLQLPDRRAIVEDERFRDFATKVKAAGFRVLQSLGRHVLPFAAWAEAKRLGVELPEASQLLHTWHAAPLDSDLEPMFGRSEPKLLSETGTALLVSGEVENQHTLEAALQTVRIREYQMYQESAQFEGYAWYDRLPRLMETVVLVDGDSIADWKARGVLRPRAMELKVFVEQADRPETVYRLPISIHVEDEEGLAWDGGAVDLLAVENSPWDNDKLKGPFDVVEFLIAATFCAGDDVECDSWETQKNEFQKDVERKVNEYFRGTRAALLALLEDALTWDVRNYAKEIGVQEIRFRKPAPDTYGWHVELVTDDPLPQAA